MRRKFPWSLVALSIVTFAIACGGGTRNPLPGSGTDGGGHSGPPLPSSGTGLRGEYFDSENLTNSVLVRVDSKIDFDWSAGPPAGVALTTQAFSVRWTGEVEALRTGSHTFTLASEDGARLWVNGQLVVDGWTSTAMSPRAGTLQLTAGQRYDFRLEYHEAGAGPASVRLSWAYPDQAEQVVPASQLFPGPLPDAFVPPPNDQTVITSMPDTTTFLYSGPDAVQIGVSPGTIDKERVTVVRGRVLGAEGAAAPGVRITVLGHPELGHTLSRSDGAYDLAVNGGVPVTLSFALDGFLSVQRQVPTPWRDYSFVPDVVLTPFDSVVTAIATSASAAQVARGSLVTDEAGSRQATVIFPPGTTARIMLPDGGVENLSTLHVRATEYTVGPSGPQRMPATLPPRSGYTYAVELSVDEALARGAENVEFSTPVSFYVENFINFPLGSAVPVGFYDRSSGTWRAAPDGRVIKVLGITGGLADLDVEGTGQAATPTTLASLGITDSERQQLALLHPIGTPSLWRVALTHFSPWDCNWPYGGPDDADYPSAPPESPDSDPNPTCTDGSIIECENSVLREQLPITGTDQALTYRSDRVAGRTAEYTTLIHLLPIPPKIVPASLSEIVVEVIGVGQYRTWSFFRSLVSSLPATLTYTWDGLDGYGRPVNGPKKFRVRVGYRFAAIYRGVGRSSGPGGGASFGAAGGSSAVDANRERNIITYWTEWPVTLGTVRQLASGLGGWSLSDLHTFAPEFGIVFRGDGTRTEAVASAPVLKGVVGGGGTAPVEGGPALGMWFGRVASGAAIAPDGTLLFIVHRQVWRVKRNGTLELVAGSGDGGGDPPPFYGDGQPAKTVLLPESVSGLAVAPDGTIYFTQAVGSLVRKVSPDGILSTVAGNGLHGHTGDGGPALQARLHLPQSVALDGDGNLYIGEFGGGVVRRVDANGIITTFAGNGQFGPALAEGLPPTSTAIGPVKQVAVDKRGTVYVSSFDNVVWQFDATGNSRVIFGGIPPSATQPGETFDGQLARGARTGSIEGLAVLPDDRLVISETANHRLRLIDFDGSLLTLAGNGTNGFAYSGAPVTGVPFSPWLVTLAPDGTLYTFPNNNAEPAYQIVPLNAGYWAQVLVGSPDGREIYAFTSAGRHQRTLDALTGKVTREFTYDGNGRLTTIADAYGNTLSIQRDASGNPTAIDAPFGQHTTLTTDSSGYLASVTNPANETYALQHTSLGLLTSLKDPKQQIHSFQYDRLGRLTKDMHPSGGFKQLDRARVGNTKLQVDVTTALGRRTQHILLNPGSSYVTRMVIRPDGTQKVTTDSGGAYRTTQFADGSTRTVSFNPDSRFGMFSALPSWTFTTPSGLTARSSSSRFATLSVSTDPLSVTAVTTTTTYNSSTWVATFDVATLTGTLRSPLGKVSTRVLDENGRVVKTSVPGLADVSYSYDSKGRLQSIQQGTRRVSLTFGTDGLPLSSVDALNRTTVYTRDPVGRVRSAQLPASRTVGFDYDPNGNLTSLTPAAGPLHHFFYGPRDEETRYTPPAVVSPPASGIGTRSTEYAYDLDGAQTGISLPDETSVATNYDAAGRLETVQTERTTVRMHYAPDAGQLIAMTDQLAGGPTSSASNVAFTYDGPLLASTTWTGAVNGTARYTYNSNLQVATSDVFGTPIVANAYDLDLLLSGISVGATSPVILNLTRNVQNGVLTGTSVGSITTTQGYDQYGAVASLGASTGSTSLYSATLTPDQAGRIKQKVETVQGVTHTYSYTYDDAGRLTDVSIDGSAAGHWTYDANGNRLTGTVVGVPGTSLSGAYDDQDRLITYGNANYEFGPRGDLRSKTASGSTTTYRYDTLGALVAVVLPSGDRIDYVLDAMGRRIGKKVNGVLERGWLYEGFRPAAEVDGTGAVATRFIYGTRPHVPDMMWKGAVLYRFVTDERGSIRLVVNTSTGAVAQRLDYDEWGNVTIDTAPGFQPFGFAGGLWDVGTKFTRFGARDYDAETGRWTNKDPIRFSGGDPNLYAYVFNDPVNAVDPSGLTTFGFSFGGAIGWWLGGGSATTSIVFDTHGGIGIMSTRTLNIGWQIGASTVFGPFVNWNADTINDLNGVSRSWSANLGHFGGGGLGYHPVTNPAYLPADGPMECKEGTPDPTNDAAIDGVTISLRSPGFIVGFSPLDLNWSDVIVLRAPKK